LPQILNKDIEMLVSLRRFYRHPFYWLAIILTGLGMESVALYYQYGLDYGPCILCTHIRAWTLAIVLVAAIGLVGRLRRAFNALSHLVMLGLGSGLLYSSWQTLGIERGFIEGSCDFDAGYPSWLPLNEWWPAVFEPWELCGYTPDLLFGVTMAEALVVVAVLAIINFVLATYCAVTTAGSANAG
jgi:disulfide bond formation protein DsbB